MTFIIVFSSYITRHTGKGQDSYKVQKYKNVTLFGPDTVRCSLPFPSILPPIWVWVGHGTEKVYRPSNAGSRTVGVLPDRAVSGETDNVRECVLRHSALSVVQNRRLWLLQSFVFAHKPSSVTLDPPRERYKRRVCFVSCCFFAGRKKHSVVSTFPPSVSTLPFPPLFTLPSAWKWVLFDPMTLKPE